MKQGWAMFVLGRFKGERDACMRLENGRSFSWSVGRRFYMRNMCVVCVCVKINKRELFVTAEWWWGGCIWPVIKEFWEIRIFEEPFVSVWVAEGLKHYWMMMIMTGLPPRLTLCSLTPCVLKHELVMVYKCCYCYTYYTTTTTSERSHHYHY